MVERDQELWPPALERIFAEPYRRLVQAWGGTEAHTESLGRQDIDYVAEWFDPRGIDPEPSSSHGTVNVPVVL